MARKATEDEFVDLYNLMELPPDAEASAIRKRMNELYLEAQQNLDHRNVKKRLQYQQMYELYLPQARHLLLDPARRAEYDRYLKAYHSGHLPPPAPLAEEKEAVDTSTDVSAGTSADAASSAEVSFNFDDAELAEAQEPVDPEKQAAEREQLWARWKTGLEHVLVDDDGNAAPADAEYDTTEYSAGYDTTEEYDTGGYAPEDQAEDTQFDFDGSAASGTVADVAPAPTVGPRSPAPRSTARPTAPGTAAARPATGTARPAATRRAATLDPDVVDLNDPEKIKEIEHQREVRRYSLIKQAAERAGLYWGWGTGTAFFFGACLLFYFLDDYLTRTRNHPIDRSIFNALCLIGIIFLSVLVGWMASSSARQRIIDELSHLALPDLVRRTRGK